MPNKNGIWNQDEADKGHLFSYRVAQFIGLLFEKHIVSLDFGCGKGAYIRYLKDIGFVNSFGFEGTQLKDFETNSIIVQDLSKKFNSSAKGNIICLEVGEHIPANKANILFDNIKNNCIIEGWVFMSWAIPGQEGDGHINCQPNEWVIEQMKSRGFGYMPELTQEARNIVEGYVAYFKETILIFKKSI